MGHDDKGKGSCEGAGRNPKYPGAKADAWEIGCAAVCKMSGIRTCISWLLPGAAAGILLALAVTYQEYRSFSEFAGAVLEQGGNVWERAELESGDSEKPWRETEKQGEIIQKNTARKVLAAAAKNRSSRNREAGEAFLREYGYRTWGHLWRYLPFTLGICIVLSDRKSVV